MAWTGEAMNEVARTTQQGFEQGSQVERFLKRGFGQCRIGGWSGRIDRVDWIHGIGWIHVVGL